jgi:hypothetical protein
MFGVVHFTSKGVVLLNSPHKLVTNSYREGKIERESNFPLLIAPDPGSLANNSATPLLLRSPSLYCPCVVVLDFRVFSIGIVVGHVQMGLLIIMVSQPKSLLAGGVVEVDLSLWSPSCWS